MYFISPSKHLFKGSASNRSIAVHFLNFFEQILAGWDPTYQTLDVTVDFTFRTCICGYCKKKNVCHCMKSVCIRIFFWSLFSRIQKLWIWTLFTHYVALKVWLNSPRIPSTTFSLLNLLRQFCTFWIEYISKTPGVIGILFFKCWICHSKVNTLLIVIVLCDSGFINYFWYQIFILLYRQENGLG